MLQATRHFRRSIAPRGGCPARSVIHPGSTRPSLTHSSFSQGSPPATVREGFTRYNLSMVYIFGKDSCPYTQAALDDYARRKVPFEYVNVKKKAADLDRMLLHSKGRRVVPVIVDGDKVTIGFGGT